MDYIHVEPLRAEMWEVSNEGLCQQTILCSAIKSTLLLSFNSRMFFRKTKWTEVVLSLFWNSGSLCRYSMDELVRQCVNNYFEKCDFKNKLTNFCTKYAFFTISQLKLNPPPPKKAPKQKAQLLQLSTRRMMLYYSYFNISRELLNCFTSLIFFSHATILVMGWLFVESRKS